MQGQITPANAAATMAQRIMLARALMQKPQQGQPPGQPPGQPQMPATLPGDVAPAAMNMPMPGGMDS